MSAQVNVSVRIVQGNLTYQNQPTAFSPAVNGTNGPTPGATTISTNGTDVTFSQLDSLGGLCVLRNIDPTNYVTVGIRDKTSNEFYPLMDILPGETYPIRLSKDLGKEEAGTGTFSGSNAVFHAKSNTANVILTIDAFDP